MADDAARSYNSIDRLLAIMARLRDAAAGCPWDMEQTFETIAPYTIEEAYEVADAIERRDWDGLRGELGDLLLQVVYHARMAEEEGRFAFHDVAHAICEKMVRRHPHVFGPEGDGRTADQQTAAWEAQKAAERRASGESGTLAGVALGLPALTRALKLQKRLAQVGFDWREADEVLAKVMEEAREVADAETEAEREAEMGDLLFSVVNLARHLGVDPEAALRRANGKVERRFAKVEAGLAERGTTPQEAALTDMDALWGEAKFSE